MKIVCLDLEGVLVPEIWINVAKRTGIEELRRTTRDEPDYNKLMRRRIEILKEHSLTLSDIQAVIASMGPMEGAKAFLDELRSLTQVIILSDTFVEFAKPLMARLDWPTIWCNSLEVKDGMITRHKLRQEEGKFHAVQALKALNFSTFAAGDSYNDLKMILEADEGCLFRAPKTIIESYPHLVLTTTYGELMDRIKEFLTS
ncbi:MAG: phosphoserine phosphatase [Spirochaetes bacterium ADurb.Bin315]|jgi:phosphoserine/homoserine phosphotransferase|nr:bifunctional phosphoserine phosphatase/homoserine phosphotransferase ThrH [Spirochaetota bacterium]NLL25375.1 bifunctional phosphoserine phosphatase/homoserine phosphotransferase ThrH [Spirochaetales bacterium]OQA43366.1 MAG: phosphoserine phosphatase [Spirochaetes bacterium ADurb.Bin315]TAH57278.1 MAG: bifunctional phosphoserine phosphatase/homoserine phosphotransferase ThrH [Sphaerochaeta sp.]HOE89087.1 bifunctional phosphoserine phosphatase/homoserine phosphotransferase ThrH [Sphaerochaet